MNMCLCRFSIKIERLSLQELKISLAEIIVTPLALKLLQLKNTNLSSMKGKISNILERRFSESSQPINILLELNGNL